MAGEERRARGERHQPKAVIDSELPSAFDLDFDARHLGIPGRFDGQPGQQLIRGGRAGLLYTGQERRKEK